jgi:putative ABC transport system ATP-binding protein
MNKPIIEIKDLTKTYRMGDIQVRALQGVSLQVHTKDLIAIMGPSGSGKSTLMNIVGCLDKPTAGHYHLGGVNVSTLDDNRLAQIRNQKIGFVFQSFNLLPRTSALANVELPMVYKRVPGKERRRRAIEALEAVGLGDRVSHKPNELSGGQQQRVAIARSLVNRPALILADEPTGNLDSKSGAEILAIFQRLNDQEGITIVFVTHEPEIAQHTRRIIRLADGRVVSDEVVLEQKAAGEHAYQVRARDLTRTT